jgi:hypothetical protein
VSEPEHEQWPELYRCWLAQNKRRDTVAARGDFRDYQRRLVRTSDLAFQGWCGLLNTLEVEGVIGRCS